MEDCVVVCPSVGVCACSFEEKEEGVMCARERER